MPKRPKSLSHYILTMTLDDIHLDRIRGFWRILRAMSNKNTLTKLYCAGSTSLPLCTNLRKYFVRKSRYIFKYCS